MSDAHSRPWWLTEGIRDVDHAHETIAFMVRRGGAAEFDVLRRRKEQMFSEQWAADHAHEGNFLETCFFKGHGLAAEADEMAHTREFIKHCHAHDLRVGVYTQWGSIFNETFFLEEPAARDWVQIGVSGKPIEYEDRINQYYRWRGCPGNPDFLDYIRKACRVAIEDYNVDVIYFDNMCLFEYHDTLCYCPRCQEGFKAHLAAAYPAADDLFARVGIRSVEHVYCPPLRPWSDFTVDAFPIKDPMIQEFIEFRCRQFADAWQAIYEYIQSVRPSVGLMGNPSFPRKYNERLTGAIDMWMLRRTPAVYYMENAVRNVRSAGGEIVTNVRGYKYGRALGENVTFVPCGGSETPGLTFAESLAFNNGSGKIDARRGDAYRPLLDFFNAHRDEFYRDVTSAAEVAVLRHDRSLTLRWHETFCAMELAQQQLQCAGVPWMPVWEHQLTDGTLEKSGYKVLVVPGSPCISRDEAAAIERFARAGGGVVVVENAGTFSEYHNTLERWRFADLFGVADDRRFVPRYVDRNNHCEFNTRTVRLAADVGQGQAVYLPQIRATREPVRTYEQIGGYDSFMHLRLPKYWRDLAKAVARVAPEPLGLTVDGPKDCWAELLRGRDGRLLLHLVNYAPRGSAKDVQVILANREAGRKVTCYAPDRSPEGKPLKVTSTKRGHAAIKLPPLKRYALVVME